MGSLAKSLKALISSPVPVTPRHRTLHETEVRGMLLRMELKTYREAFLRTPCQAVRTGRRFDGRFAALKPLARGCCCGWWSGGRYGPVVLRGSARKSGSGCPTSAAAIERKNGGG